LQPFFVEIFSSVFIVSEYGPMRVTCSECSPLAANMLYQAPQASWIDIDHDGIWFFPRIIYRDVFGCFV
jgi:hypothetical protein